MTNKNRNIITVAVLAITASTIMGTLVSTYMQQAASAQSQNSTIGTMLGIMRTMMKTQNITGSVRIAPTLLQTIQSKASVTLTTAITNAERGVGPNSHAIFARLGIVNGYLVYIVNVIDANHSIHRITVDAGNGKVLTSQQIPFGLGLGLGGMMGLGGMTGLGDMMGQGGLFGLGGMMGPGGMFGLGGMLRQHALMFGNLSGVTR